MKKFEKKLKDLMNMVRTAHTTAALDDSPGFMNGIRYSKEADVLLNLVLSEFKELKARNDYANKVNPRRLYS